jgi:hypothetical protein
MCAIRGPNPSVPRLAKESSLTHHPEDFLMINRDPFPVQLGGDPTIAIARKLFCQFLDPVP